jgi:hypothetical protein
MDELKKLKAEQLKAIKSGNYPQLNEINKQIYNIREARRKEREAERQKQREERTNARILEALAI